MEEEARQRAEERLQKLEEERKRRIEEARKKMAEEEKKRKEEIQRIAAEAEKAVSQPKEQRTESTPKDLPNTTDDDIDLLGGLSEASSVIDLREEEEKRQRQLEKQKQQNKLKDSGARKDPSRIVTTRTGSFGETEAAHRDLPTRGRVDESVDRYLDDQNLSVRVVKHGQTDGVYLFGSRIMKTALEQNLIIVISDKKRRDISTWISECEKTEMLRARGMDSAMQAVNMMNAGLMSMNPEKSPTTKNNNNKNNDNNSKKPPPPALLPAPQPKPASTPAPQPPKPASQPKPASAPAPAKVKG